MADVKFEDIKTSQEGNIATFEFPDIIKDFENFEAKLGAILHVNIEVYAAKIKRESDKIKVTIIGYSNAMDLENFRKIINGVAIQY